MPTPKLSLDDCQYSAEAALRQANSGNRPVDAGLVQHVRNAVAAAYKLGQQNSALVPADAYQLFLDNDDPDVLRDTLTELLPADYSIGPRKPT